MNQRCIIIGASHTAAQLAPSLRQQGWEGDILVIGNEAVLPYHRPPLSKAYLSSDKSSDSLLIRQASMYEKRQINFMLNTEVTAIDRINKTVTTASGQQLDYTKLALCTGASVRKIPLGKDLKGVHYLRDIADAERIRDELGSANNAVIIGGGYIGLETAAALKTLGLNVSVIESQTRVLARVCAPQLSAFYQKIHRQQGVDIRCGRAVSKIEGSTEVEAVVLDDGEVLPADLVIIGVGVMPNTQLAEAAGLAIRDRAILVDEFAQSSDPDIVAAGDCCIFPSAFYKRFIHLESVQNTLDQAKVAVSSILGLGKTYDPIPNFWSDQYDLKLQIVGLNQGYEEVVLRNFSERALSVLYIAAGRIIAADCINAPKDFSAARMLISAETQVNTELLSNPELELKDLLA